MQSLSPKRNQGTNRSIKRPYETSVDNPPIGASVPIEDYSSSEPVEADDSENVAGITRIDDFADFTEPGSEKKPLVSSPANN